MSDNQNTPEDQEILTDEELNLFFEATILDLAEKDSRMISDLIH